MESKTYSYVRLDHPASWEHERNRIVITNVASGPIWFKFFDTEHLEVAPDGGLIDVGRSVQMLVRVQHQRPSETTVKELIFFVRYEDQEKAHEEYIKVDVVARETQRSSLHTIKSYASSPMMNALEKSPTQCMTTATSSGEGKPTKAPQSFGITASLSSSTSSASTPTSPSGSCGQDFQTSFIIAIKTSDIKDAGTSSSAFLQVTSDGGSTRIFHLSSSLNHRHQFQQGQSDVFVFLRQPYLGRLTEIDLWQDQSGKNPTWHVSGIEIHESNSALSYWFEVNRWVTQRVPGSMTSGLKCIRTKDHRQEVVKPVHDAKISPNLNAKKALKKTTGGHIRK